MAIKDLIKSLTGKKELPAAMQENAPAPLASDAFPVYRADELDLSKYRKIPLASLAAMGAAFSQLPEEARMVMGAMKGTVGLEQPMFRAINLHGATGWMKLNDGITSGRIFRMNEQGKNVYSGQMYFKEVAAQEMSGATSMVMPIDPVTMAIAVALFSVEQKLGDIQAKVEEVLRFLKLEKQSQQRGNLKMLSEIMAEFKRGGMDEQLRTVRMNATQAIRRDAHKDMLFYQEQISTQLGEQKAIHSVQQAQHLQDQVMGEFCEYQLACHLYAYSTMLETVLHGTYAAEQLAHTVETMQTHADRYDALYEQCRAQLASYQRSAVQSKLLGGLGSAAKAVGEKLATVPVLSKGTVDEALINAGDSLGQRNRDAVARRLERFALLADSHMRPFVESVAALDAACNQPRGMITDGKNVYVLGAA